MPGAVAGAGVEALTARGSSGASDPDGRPFATPDLRGRRVLLAEDTPDIREILEAFVSRTGAETDVVCDGAEAVERVFLAQAEGRPYDVVLMDLKMPVMDGLEATERLRASGFARPVIALTAFVLGEDADRALRAGCNARLTKPVTSADLYQELERHLAGRETSADGTR